MTEAKVNETWHKVTVIPQYRHLDPEQVWICACGMTEAISISSAELANTSHYPLDEEEHYDRIIADHAQAAAIHDARRVLEEMDHREDCDSIQLAKYPEFARCDCGLAKALAALTPAKTGEP